MAGTTSHYGFPYDTGTDQVPTWPTRLKNLADAVDTELFNGLAAKLDAAGSKILQIVRASDSTNRSTTSTTFVDVTGMAVTITPQKATSNVLVLATFDSKVTYNSASVTVGRGVFGLTNSSDVGIPGGYTVYVGNSLIPTSGLADLYGTHTLIGWASPATISAVTYKLRFAVNSGAGVAVMNGERAGQIFAMEVSA